MECYIFHPDRTGERFTAALAERARPGVDVRIVFDRFGSRRLRNVVSLTAAGCRVAWHPRSRWRRAHRLTNSTHREILVVDGSIGFTGGAGISDNWGAAQSGWPPWRDSMVRVEGPVVASIQSVFAENWLECRGEILIGDEWFPRLEPRGTTAAFAVANSPAHGAARGLLQALIQCAEREIRIATPYFVPDPSFLRALIDRATHGVSVLLLLPGRHMEHPWVRLISRRLFDPLLRAGVRIFEYQPTMLHQKLLIVDERWTVVGTMNLDMMSFEYLDEINLAVINSAFARTAIEQHEADVQKSVELTLPSWRRNWLEVITAEAVWLAAGQNWVHRLGRTNVASRRSTSNSSPEDAFADSDIDIGVGDGAVTLSGTIPSEVGRTRRWRSRNQPMA